MSRHYRSFLALVLCFITVWAPLAPVLADPSLNGQRSIESQTDEITRQAISEIAQDPRLRGAAGLVADDLGAEQARITTLISRIKAVRSPSELGEGASEAEEVFSILVTAKLADTLAIAAGKGSFFLQSRLTELAHDGINLADLQRLVGAKKFVEVPFAPGFVETANQFLNDFVDRRTNLRLGDIIQYKASESVQWDASVIPAGPALERHKKIEGVRNFIIPFLSFMAAFIGGFVAVTNPSIGKSESEMIQALQNAFGQLPNLAGYAAVGAAGAWASFRAQDQFKLSEKIERAVLKLKSYPSEAWQETSKKLGEGLPLLLSQTFLISGLTIGVTRLYGVDALHIMIPSLFAGLAAWLLEWQFSAFSKALWSRYFWNGALLNFNPVNRISPEVRGAAINVGVNVGYGLVMATFTFAGALVSTSLGGLVTGWQPPEGFNSFLWQLTGWSTLAFVLSFGLPQVLVSNLRDKRVVPENFRFALESFSVFFNGAIGRILSYAAPASLAISIAGVEAKANVGVAIMATHFLFISLPITAYFLGRRYLKADQWRSWYASRVLSKGGADPLTYAFVKAYRATRDLTVGAFNGTISALSWCGRRLSGLKPVASAPNP